MGEIKQYKPLALVFYIDGNGDRSALPLDEEKVADFKRACETTKMIELEGTVINTHDIKEIRPSWRTTELEKFYYARSIEERNYITKRVRARTNHKVNVIDSLAELGEEKAITMMINWLEGKQQEVKKEEVKCCDVSTTPLTEKQKRDILERFSNLKQSFKSR